MVDVREAGPDDTVVVGRGVGIGDLLMMKPGVRRLCQRTQVVLAIPEVGECLFSDVDVRGFRRMRSGSLLPLRSGECGVNVSDIGNEREGDLPRPEAFAEAMGVRLLPEDAVSLSVPRGERVRARQWLRQQGKPRVGLAWRSRDPWRTWPHWREFAALIGEERVVLIDDRQHEYTGPQTAGRLPLSTAAAVAAQLAVVVATNVGPLHLAASVGAPVIGLFGGWPAEVFCSRHPTVTAISDDACSCRPCYGRRWSCSAPPPCLAQISARRVAKLVRGFIE